MGCAGPVRRYSNCAFASGHSPERMLYITVSRMVPSRRSAWPRITPSLRAPSRSMAACEAKLKLSVRQPTTWQPSVSKAWPISSSLQVVLMWVRWQRLAYQV
jgi:hypothetical protein